MKNINFIVTCYNREDYWPHLKSIFKEYKLIKPNIRLVYTGDNINFTDCIKIANRGHASGEYDCVTTSYNALKLNGCQQWIKIGIDSWLLDESKILDIFDVMEQKRCGYSGTYWGDNVEGRTNDISTDIFFSDIRFGNVFEKMIQSPFDINKYGYRFEWYVADLLKSGNININLLRDRWPISNNPDCRFRCKKFGWTMSHDLNENLQFLNEFRKASS